MPGSGGVELHRLPEWSSESAPVDFQDWLMLIDPQMSDLTASSSEWWNKVVNAARSWYQKHQTLKPIEKLQHEIKAPSEIQKAKWNRLERRASSMLLQAVPEAQKEDIIASKSLSVLGILTRLMVNYQPGGAQEKAAVLIALEMPQEANSVGEAISGLRRWLRWKRRALDINVMLPDPSVMLRGLDRLVGKVLGSQPTLQFRVNLTRTTLMVDSMPTMGSIEQLAECLLAEFDQMSYSRRREKAAQMPKVKKADVRDPPDEKKKEDKKEAPCRFLLSEEGCRRGRGCKFSHDQKDDQKRCWTCGSTKHFSGKCPLKTADPQVNPTPKAKVMKKGDQVKGKARDEDEVSEKAAVCPSEDMKGLLEEASRMLRSMNGQSSSEGSVSSSEESGDARIRSLQRQLNDLKGASFKVLRLARVKADEEARGLIDSGATHALRPQMPGEPIGHYSQVHVTLAGDKKMVMKLSPGGVIVGQPNVEPIVPMGALVTTLGCTLQWADTHLVINHPTMGQIPTVIQDGCPMVSKPVAMQLICELEGKPAVERLKVQSFQSEEMMEWFERLTKEHPAFQGIPERLRKELVVPPEVNAVAGNRRFRKLWKKQKGVILHLYSGENDGFTFKRAVKDLGGDVRKVIEVDLKNGEQWNMVEGPLYGELLAMAFDGQFSAILSGPNCRTRSRLRHIEIPGLNMPKPVRSWGDGEWGKEGISPEEFRKCHEDDVMLLRLVTLYVVSEEVRKATQQLEPVKFAMEHPSLPEGCPEAVSWWGTMQWQALRTTYNLDEFHVDQGELGGGKKPTTFGGNVKIEVPESWTRTRPKPRNVQGKNEAEIIKESKGLARWTPVLMSAVAEAVMRAVGMPVKPRIWSWRTHLRREHVPFRKDCLICQQAAARGRPHLKQKLPPRAGVMSIDTAGPLITAEDVLGKQVRFMLVASFTWPTGGTGSDVPEEEVGEVEGPVLEVEGIEGEEEDQREEVEEPEEERQEAEERRPDDPQGEDPPEGDVQVAVYRLALPMPDRKAGTVLATIIDMYMHLRADGFVVSQLHSDRASEFCSTRLAAWCRERSILQTWTPGGEPQSNGRAERAVQEVKARVRKMLHGAEVGSEWWPLALRNVNERLRMQRIGKEESFPPFLSDVLIKKRLWRSRELEPTHEKVKYISPSWLDHGHWVWREDDTFVLTKAVITGTTRPQLDDGAVWIGVADDLDPLEVRRRIRGKAALRSMKEEEDPWRQEIVKRIEKVMEEEMIHLVQDDAAVAPLVLTATRALGDAIHVEDQEDQVLQTKIVSPAEVKRCHEAWKDAIQAEIKSLFETKQALRVVEGEEAKRMIKEQQIQALPSKLVFTLKPDPQNPRGKKKCRIVACGNFAKEEQMDCFASGTDATTLRLAMSWASQRAWHGVNLDVRTAFLNAPMQRPATSEAGVELKPVLLKPAQLLVTLGYFTASQFWMVLKAVYGFRQSPKLWSDHRDDTLRTLKVEDLELQQMETEPNAWMIKKEGHSGPQGVILTYVDDILILSDERIAQAWTQKIKGVWETTEPEWIKSDRPTRFLGMELFRDEEGVWSAFQVNYTLDLLHRNLGGDPERWKQRKIPMSKDPCEEEEEDEEEEGQSQEKSPRKVSDEKKIEVIREAQRVVGELIWLVTRCRPDLMYVTSRMSSLSTRNPQLVLQMAEQVWKYLAKTYKEGLVFKCPREDACLEVFTDASFGEECQGCVIVKWGEAPILWKSSRQNLQVTSTAAAELVEVMEGAVMAEAIRVVVEEFVEGRVQCWQYTDSSSALAIVAGETASWKTKHLRKRAKYLRWKVSRGDVALRHGPGSSMIADLGTKPLAAARLEQLKEGLGMIVSKAYEEKKKQAEEIGGAKVEEEDTEAEKKEEKKSEEKGGGVIGKERQMKLAILMALIGRCQAQGGDEDDRHEGWSLLNMFVMMYTVMIILITLLLRRLWENFQGMEVAHTSEEEESDPDSEGPGLEMFGQERPRRQQRRATPGMGIIRNGVMEPRPDRRNQDGGGSRRSPSTRTPTEPSRSRSGQRSQGSEGQNAQGSQGSVPTRPPSTRASPIQEEGEEEVPQEEDYMAQVDAEMRRREQVAQQAAENPPTPSPNDEPYDGGGMVMNPPGPSQEINGHGRGQQQMPHPPGTAYPAEMTRLFLTPTGAKYHLNRQCRGLQSAAVVLESPRCPPIEPPWNPGNRRLFGAGVGEHLHGSIIHKIVSTEKPHLYREFEPCNVCAGNRGKGKKGKGDAEGGKGTWIL